MEPNTYTWEQHKHLLTQARQATLQRAASGRTYRFCLVLQDLYQPHNIAACMRSAEAFGIQRVHVVTPKTSLKRSAVAKGTGDWLTLEYHTSIEGCVAKLRDQGYTIAAGMPPQQASCQLETLPIDNPLALLFGNEHNGIGDLWRAHVDLPFTIPMVGLVESLNISVSAAITMQHLTARGRRELTCDFYVNPHEQQTLLSQWIHTKYGA